MKMNRKNIWILTAIGIFLPIIALAQERGDISRSGRDFVETIDKTFKVGEGGTLYVNTSMGAIRTDSWDKKEVRVVVEKIADARNESGAKEMFAEFEVFLQ